MRLTQSRPWLHVAAISVHACPLAAPGAWETGGMNVYIREVSRHLSRLGVAVDVYTRLQGPEHSMVVQLADHARVIHIPAGPARYMPKEQVVQHLPEFICNMREFINNDEATYDVVHAHYWLSGRVAGYFKNVWHVPMVAMFHTLAEMKNQVSSSVDETESDVRFGIEQLTVETADRVLASTPADRAHLGAYYGADDGQLVIVPCGVDLETFRPGPQQAARHALGLGDDATLLFVGRIQQLKGIEILLRAAATLKFSIPRFRVLVVGGRPSGDIDDPEAREIARLRTIARNLGVEDVVRWVGAVEHEDLARYYQAADVTVMPSTYESFGLVAIESMACATPVVAARVGGLESTIQDGQTGFLISRRDPDLYAARIGELLGQSSLREQMGRQARTRAETFAWSNVAQQLAAMYDALAQADRSTLSPVLSRS